jgi:ATP-dependent 26S proteasome regulatory subunit
VRGNAFGDIMAAARVRFLFTVGTLHQAFRSWVRFNDGPRAMISQVEEKPDVTYNDVGGCKEQIEKLREVVELPLLHVCGYFAASLPV